MRIRWHSDRLDTNQLSDRAVQVQSLTHRYGNRLALDSVSFDVSASEIFGFLGPNGSGKTTLFRILSTLIRPQSGSVHVLGFDVVRDQADVRKHIGVVFQAPSLDKMLTARENLMHQGHLYGICGAELKDRINDSLSRVGLLDRADQRVSGFSGGMRRRVEIAKGLLHRPRLLILDEPSTGLDPSARIDLWSQLTELQSRDGMTILLTTHLMDEADRCSRLAILDHGQLVACDTPAAMKDRIGGDVITLNSRKPETIQQTIRQKLSLESELLDGSVRIERRNGHELVPQLIEALPGLVDSVSVGKPTLEDVFIQATGKSFKDEDALISAPSH